MNDPFKIITEDLTQASKDIKKDTDTLRTDTDTKIGQIDDTGKELPNTMYSMLLPLFTDMKAYLGRSMDIRDRISMILDEIAKAVEEQEKQFEKDFKQLQPPSTNNQSTNNDPNH